MKQPLSAPKRMVPRQRLASLNPFAGAWYCLRVFRHRLGGRLYLVFLLSLVSGVAEGFGIALLLPLLARLDLGVGAARHVPAPIDWVVRILGVNDSLLGILLLIGGMFFLKGFLVFGYRAYSGYLQAQLMRELKAKVFDACSRMSYDYYTGHNTGHFVNVITTQVDRFLAAFSGYVSFLTRIIQAMAYLLFAMLLAWRFGITIIVVGLVVLLLFTRLNRYVRELSRRSSTELSHLNKVLVQALQAFKYLTSTQGMERMGSGVGQSVHRVTDYQVRQHIWAAFSGAVNEPISIALIISVIIAQVGVLNQPLGPILVAILLFYRGMGQLLQVQVSWQSTLNNIGSVEMVEAELAALDAHREQGGGRQIDPLRCQIELDNVSFSYGPNLDNVLSDISLTIPAFSTVAVVGESGAGKSTLIDMLTLLLKPHAGELRIDGVPAREIELSSWRRQIGYVSQETVVFDDSIAANIALADIDSQPEREILDRVRVAAGKAHLAHFIETLPEGYMTKVGDRGILLSGGQRQRLFIARELLKTPRLLILDEATSALDSESERAIQASIDELRGTMTVVIIAHRLSTIRNVDQVFVLEHGRLVEQGTYKELLERNASRFGNMVALQAL